MARDKASAFDSWWPAGCLAALLLFAGISAAQTAPAAGSPAASPTAAAQGISYKDGELTIHVVNTTLTEVLGKVAKLTGVVIELPAGAGVEKMQIVELGPGPARQVLASLLSESNFDYLIQAVDDQPEKIQSVLLMPRGKKEATPGGAPGPGNPLRNFRSAVTAVATPPPPEEPVAPAAPEPVAPATAAPATTAPATAEVQPAALSPADSQSQSQQAQVPVPPQQPVQPAYAPLDPSALPSQAALAQPLPQGLNADTSTSRPGALTPPAVMDQQSISQQLQQMYQTRVQMNQVGRQ
jgi:hypothetical protein